MTSEAEAQTPGAVGGPSNANANAMTTLTDVVCAECACLCDDLTLTIDTGESRVVATVNACAWSIAKLTEDRCELDRGEWPEATVAGEPTDSATALAAATALLSRARAPLILGLTRSTVEAQREALALADACRAAIDWGARSDLGRISAIQRLGKIGADLTEVKNRADLVVFWQAPILPRHGERYSIEPSGRFVPNGRVDRTILAAHSEPEPWSALADAVWRLRPERSFETLACLRAAVNGRDLDPDHVLEATGLSWDEMRSWANRMTSARYGAFFLGSNAVDALTWDAAVVLVRDLNRATRFVLLTIGGAGNAAGAESALTSGSGSPRAVNYSTGAPRYRPFEDDALSRLERGEADAVLIVGPVPAELAPWLKSSAVPQIVIAPDATAPIPAPASSSVSAAVALRCAEFGLEVSGTIQRADGPMLPLRAIRPRRRPSDGELLAALHDRLSARREEPKP